MGDVGTLFMEGRSHRLEFLELQPPMLGTPGAEVVAEATPPRRSLPPPRPLKSIHFMRNMSDPTHGPSLFSIRKHSSVHYAQRKLDFGAKSANETWAPKLRFLATAFTFTFAFKTIN